MLVAVCPVEAEAACWKRKCLPLAADAVLMPQLVHDLTGLILGAHLLAHCPAWCIGTC